MLDQRIVLVCTWKVENLCTTIGTQNNSFNQENSLMLNKFKIATSFNVELLKDVENQIDASVAMQCVMCRSIVGVSDESILSSQCISENWSKAFFPRVKREQIRLLRFISASRKDALC